MNLQPVHATPYFRYVCASCAGAYTTEPGRRDSSPAVADLDGEAFKAYYCADCARIIAEMARCLAQDRGAV